MNEGAIIALLGRAKEKAHIFIENELAKNGIKDLSVSNGSILFILFKNNGKTTIKEIVEILDKTKSTVSDKVFSLEKAGYVTKRQDTEDKRVVFVELTEKGYATKEIFANVSLKLISQIYTDISDEEKKILVELVKKVGDNLKG